MQTGFDSRTKALLILFIMYKLRYQTTGYSKLISNAGLDERFVKYGAMLSASHGGSEAASAGGVGHRQVDLHEANAICVW